jgi:phage-related baseplate assembly protein
MYGCEVIVYLVKRNENGDPLKSIMSDITTIVEKEERIFFFG